MRSFLSTWMLVLIVIPLQIACKPAESPSSTTAQPTQPDSSADHATTSSKDSATKDSATKDSATQDSATQDSATQDSAVKPGEAPKVASQDPNAPAVMLGDPTLTAGIPGEGPLTVAEIENWLDDPANHLPLQVSLPMGLSAGVNAMQIPEDNQMTRAKIELGRQLYFDRRLSADGSVSCADCHHPDEGYAKHTQFGEGIGGQKGNRNSPVSYNRILSGPQFWDGRAASLEEQAVGPIANPIEMGHTHDALVADIGKNEGYRVQFEKIFPDGVNIDNIGRAIATFERAIVTGPSPYDFYEPLRTMQSSFKDDLADLEALKEDDPDLYNDYMAVLQASEAHPMSENAQRGRELFFGQKGGCTACHVGPNLTDEKYHNLGVGMDAAEPDLGRYAVTKEDKDRGAFKTPTIRNVALTAPYMHDGSHKTLEEVVKLYSEGGHPNPHLSKDIRKLDLTEQEQKDLVAFMEACTGPLPTVERGRLPQ